MLCITYCSSVSFTFWFLSALGRPCIWKLPHSCFCCMPRFNFHLVFAVWTMPWQLWLVSWLEMTLISNWRQHGVWLTLLQAWKTMSLWCCLRLDLIWWLISPVEMLLSRYVLALSYSYVPMIHPTKRAAYWMFSPTQDQCAWAIGNIAGGDSKHRQTLKDQGAIQALVNLLKVKKKSHCSPLIQ